MESKKLQVPAPDPFAFRPMTDIALIANVGLLYVPLLVRAGCSRTSWSQCRSMRNAVDVDDLWALHDENEWLDALNRYWVSPAVCKNRDIEQFMHKVDPEYVRRLDPQERYDFLNKYFRWKFTGKHLRARLMDT